jgi:hypothetical protein
MDSGVRRLYKSARPLSNRIIMLRFFARIAGFLILAAGFAAMVIDGTRSIAGQTLVLTPFGDLFRAKLPLIQQAIVQNLHPLLWDPIATALLRLPVWGVLALAGGLLIWMARRRRPVIGYTSRP